MLPLTEKATVLSPDLRDRVSDVPPQPSFDAQALTSAGMVLVLTLLTGLLYPLVFTAGASLVFPHQAGGSLIVRDGKVLGSELIGQAFDEPRYFWSRLSATGPFPYNSEASGGSNFGPTNPALTAAAKARIDALRAAEPGREDPVPVDLVTASGSGLDPHLSLAAALYQVPRVARVRAMPENELRTMIDTHTKSRLLGVIGEPVVNVLQLNLALDQRAP